MTSIKSNVELKQFIDISMKITAEGTFVLRGCEHNDLQQPNVSPIIHVLNQIYIL